MEKIEFPDQIVTRSKPGVTLKKMPDNHDGTPDCDFGKYILDRECLSGLTDFYQSRGINMWSNRNNNYDICIKCAQADRFIEIVLNQEEKLLWQLIRKPKLGDADAEGWAQYKGYDLYDKGDVDTSYESNFIDLKEIKAHVKEKGYTGFTLC